jgi:uncharacterized protein YjbJ (UPF0337 family)
MDDILKGKWNQLRGRIQQEWGELTDDELDQIEGSSTRLAGKLQEKYGRTKQEAEQEVSDWLDRVGREY